jgi:hypothetical protein
MTKRVQRAEVNTFVQGIITEASPLNFPPNATSDEENFNLSRTGLRQRRLGLDWESESDFGINIDFFGANENDTIQTYVWKRVENHPNLEVLVVRIGQEIGFYDNTKDMVFENPLNYRIFYNTPREEDWAFSEANGKLVISRNTSQLVAITLSPSFSITTDFFNLEVRDFWGVLDGRNGESSNSLTTPYRYNLENQGWGGTRVAKIGDNFSYQYPPTAYFTHYSTYPSDYDNFWIGIQTSPSTDGPLEHMVLPAYTASREGNLLAPKGAFIINALTRGASRFSRYGVSPPAGFEDATPGGPTVIEGFSGRVFYAGFSVEVIEGSTKSPNMSQVILFSQLIRDSESFGKCYQEGDPTSREYSDIVDTDGGLIVIHNCGTVVGMREMGKSLIVLASEGVWAIEGGSDYGFTATNYKVSKISNFGCISKKSVVVVNDQLYFWAENGINLIKRNQFGDLEVTNITENTIDTLYEEIPMSEKSNSHGIYDQSTNKILWYYGENKELRLDLTLGAFYKYRFYLPNGVNFVSVFETKAFNTSVDVELVSHQFSSNIVQVEGEDVGVTYTRKEQEDSTIKYLFLNQFTLNLRGAVIKARDFKDFGANDAKAYMVTGAQTAGDSSIAKQVPYLVMHFVKTEEGVLVGQPYKESSCFVRSQWDWATGVNSGKWSPLFQAYRARRPFFVPFDSSEYDSGFSITTSKNKIRGRGKAFSFYMETEPERDCQIVGWSLSLTGNSLA